ncbi:MAG: sodium:solute symporter family transporter [Chthoniobacterales bacterium]
METSGAFHNISLTDYAVFIIYLGVSLFIGLKAGGKQKDLKTYLLAGHQMSWVLISISVLASLVSGISFLGAPAETFTNNLVYLWVILAVWVATPITILVFLPFFFRLNFYTAYEYLEHRFNRSIRRISSAAFIFRGGMWLALAMYAPSLVISELLGFPLWTAIVFTSVLTLIYTTIGGMRAVIYTDVMQFLVMVIGIGIIMFVALQKIPGGLSGAWEIAEAGGRTQFWDLSFSPEKRMTTFGAFFGGLVIALVSLVTDQIAVQRYLTAKSLKESSRALWGKFVISLPLWGIFYFSGLILYAFYQSHPELLKTLTAPDRVVPHFVSTQLSAPFPGLLIAALLAATMSSVSAGVNSLTTATIMDFFYAKNQETSDEKAEKKRVRIAKYLTLGYGITATCLALVIGRLGTLVEASNKISGFFGGPLLGIFVLGVCIPRSNSQGALLGALCGFLAVAAVSYGTEISFMWYALIGFIVTCTVGSLASLCFAPPTEKQKEFTL